MYIALFLGSIFGVLKIISDHGIILMLVTIIVICIDAYNGYSCNIIIIIIIIIVIIQYRMTLVWQTGLAFAVSSAVLSITLAFLLVGNYIIIILLGEHLHLFVYYCTNVCNNTDITIMLDIS